MVLCSTDSALERVKIRIANTIVERLSQCLVNQSWVLQAQEQMIIQCRLRRAGSLEEFHIIDLVMLLDEKSPSRTYGRIGRH